MVKSETHLQKLIHTKIDTCKKNRGQENVSTCMNRQVLASILLTLAKCGTRINMNYINFGGPK